MIDFVEAVRRDGAAFLEVVRSADLGLPVPPCPGWTMRDLALHQGEVHRWAMRCIAADAYTEQPDPVIADEDLVEWMTEGLGLLVDVLRSADSQAPIWTFGPKPRTMAFWSRRMAQELAVHLWDAETAAGAPQRIDAALAADGVDEVFTVFIPRQLRLERMSEPPASVLITLPDGRDYRIGEGEPVATVTGAPDDILLALWHRLPPNRLVISGDRAAVDLAFAAALTP